MKQTLLLGLASALAFGAYANSPITDDVTVRKSVTSVKQTQGKMSKPLSSKRLGNGVMQKLSATNSGRIIRHIENVSSHKGINPAMRKSASRAAALPEGMILWESFEDKDTTDINWLPEGWSVISNGDPNLELGAQWGVDLGGAGWGVPAAPDGNYFMGIGFSQTALEQDEWLFLPQLKIEENNELKFQLYSTPLFFYETYNPDYEVIDWINMEWLVDPVVKGDLTVQVKEGDGEWKQVWSMMDQFSDLSLEDLAMYDQFDTYTVSLDEYAGKDVQIAFNYKAVDCNTIYIDCVSVGLPSLDGVSYAPPFETLYWGFDNSAEWSSLNLSIAQYPVFGPITFYNNWNVDATYAWTYHDPATNDWAVSNDQDMLELTYAPDYSSEFTRRNNMYYPPVLNASAPGASDGSYSMPVDYLQAGGKAEFMISGNDGTQSLFETGLLPFNLSTDDYGILTIDVPSIGDPALPVFGYNRNSDRYWLEYTMNGEEPSEDDAVKMVAILNFIYAPSAPLVVSGVHVNALGKMTDKAELKIEIIACDEEYVPMEEAIATATCPYSKMMTYDGDMPYLFLNIPFEFDEPVVLDNSNMAYIVKLSGFNSEEVETFIPIQSIIPNEYLCHGWLEKQIKVDSDEFRTSYTPMAYVEGIYGDCYNAFAINLDACYPWLTSDVEEVYVPADGTPVTVNLGSYYDGSVLKTNAEEITGLVADIKGRYNECELTLSHDNTEVIIEGDLRIYAPGVEKVIKVSEKLTGVSNIDADSKHGEVVSIYRIDGTKVAKADASNGIFIVKYADGTIRKAILK